MITVAAKAATVGLFLISIFGGVRADTNEERLVSVGARIFPAIISASSKLDTLSAVASINIYIVYDKDLPYARKIADRIESLKRIKGHPVQVTTISVHNLERDTGITPIALFVVERLGEKLERVIDYSLRNDTLSFSPFRGDVEAGILAGISVSDRVLPYINTHTLSMMSYALKPFFMKVAITYEP